MRNASPTSPRRYIAGDSCPVLVRDGQPCGKPLEAARWRGGLRCDSWHWIRQCEHCGSMIPSRARVDALYCTTRCRVAAHRERRVS